MKPDGRDDAAALMVLGMIIFTVLVIAGAGAYYAFASYGAAAGGL